MKKSKFTFLVMLFGISGLMCGCEKISFLNPKKSEPKKARPAIAVRGTVVAKVNNIPITSEELNQDIDAYNAMVPKDRPELKITTREQKVDYLKNDMTRRMLLYQEALDRGLDQNEEVVRALEKTKMDLLVLELIKEETQKVEVTSQDIEKFYNDSKDRMKEDEERQIREIVVPAEQDAKEVLIQLLQGEDFATIAKARSVSKSAKDGGDMGFIKKGDKKNDAFDRVAFSETLETGKISGIFKTTDGYVIIKLEAKRGGKQKSLSEMWDDIKTGLTFLKKQQKVEELINRLSEKSSKEYYEGEIR